MCLASKRAAIRAAGAPGRAPTIQVSGSERTADAVTAPGSSIGHSSARARAGRASTRTASRRRGARVTKLRTRGRGDRSATQRIGRSVASLNSRSGERVHDRLRRAARVLRDRHAPAGRLLEALGAGHPRLEADPLARARSRERARRRGADDRRPERAAPPARQARAHAGGGRAAADARPGAPARVPRVARVLIVPCGCRGRALARELRAAGHAVRGTTRDPARAPAIAAAGAEPYVGDPDRIATLMEALPGVTILCWLMGNVAAPELHGGRLRMMFEKLVDTPVRGGVYEGTPAGETLARTCADTWRIPLELLAPGEDPLPAVARLLGYTPPQIPKSR